MYREDVFDLIDRLARADRRSILNSFLDEFLHETGLADVAYVAFNLPTEGADRALLSAACGPNWRKLYVQSGRVDLGPLLRAGLGGVAPVDWGALERDDPIIGKLLSEALELDVGATGVSFPLRGRDGAYALFNVAVPDAGLSAMSRQDFIRRLMVASAIFHATVRHVSASRTSRGDLLTDRELTCLRLKASKKTDGEIGLALGASSSAARFWLETARARLNAATVAAAIEIAARMGSERPVGEAPSASLNSIPLAPSIVWRAR
ncbi:MAG: autoinducer binding domain-containing protein [Methylocystis sp.]|uniref:autoinducer binding domain-containing protein n=1 Tax=Methylocystis sp. TaxID=1911079 RepID=UPI00395EDF43